MLHGILYEKSPNSAIVECGGVGYEVTIPIGTYNELPATGQECRIHTRHIVREDDEQLYGFATKDERQIFDLLLAISGVGPKLAIAVLDGLSITDFRRCIVNGDAKRLGTVKGVGKKTAERIVVELKGKIDPVEAMASQNSASPVDTNTRDAVLALSQLGFSQEQAYKMVLSAIEAGADKNHTDELVRKALASR